MQIVNLSRDRLVEMEQVFSEAIGVPPTGVDDDALWCYFDADRSWLAIDDDDRVAGLANGFGTRLVLPGGAVVNGAGGQSRLTRAVSGGAMVPLLPGA